jgi:signal transduction histidine kinase
VRTSDLDIGTANHTNFVTKVQEQESNVMPADESVKNPSGLRLKSLEGLPRVNTEEIVDRLLLHRTIGRVPRDELVWIATHGTLRHYDIGAVIARQTQVIDELYILLAGRISIYLNRGPGQHRTMDWQAGDVTGLLPYSRLLHPPGDTMVEEPVDAVVIHRKDFPKLTRSCPEVTATLVHVMTDRARRFTSTDLRDENMLSLGRLAAGLAHELNNPASAVMRYAKLMAGTLTVAEEAARTLGAAGLTQHQMAELETFRTICMSSKDYLPLSGLALSDREDAISAWLESHGIPPTLSEDLAKTPVSIEALDRIARVLDGTALVPALHWIAGDCAVRSLVDGIERGASRIHALVAATKGFTHMDRSLEHERVDIARGLADTASLLEGKARSKSVDITLDLPPHLPTVLGFSAELNQIWMNLLDNAIDAAPTPGHVLVTAEPIGEDLVVRVIDDGQGIPEEIRESIFDPFFTTKPVGEGTGLGLDIVRRVVQWHNGEIRVESRSGRTEFRVRLPVA